MKILIKDLLKKDDIYLDIKALDKRGIIVELATEIYNKGKVENRMAFIKALLEREDMDTTGIGHGIALPHARMDVSIVKKPVGLLAISKKGVEFNSKDGNLVNIIFLMAVPKHQANMMLRFLSRMTKILNNMENKKNLFAAKNEKEVLDLLIKYD